MPNVVPPARSITWVRAVPGTVCLLAAGAVVWAGSAGAGADLRASATLVPVPLPSTAAADVTALAPPLQVEPAADLPRAGAAVAGRLGHVRPPQPAVAAYRRAAAVMGLADPACHLTWTVVAAVGGVTSDHGRSHGGHIDDERRVRPALFGTAGRRSPVADTDGGVIDGTAARDRGVGPMLLWPTTWTTIGVDADGDGRRDPQDLDDAALAAGVLLCDGTRDLSRPAALRSAVDGFHRGPGFVTAVVGLSAAYAASEAATPSSGPLGLGEVLAAAGSGIVPLGPDHGGDAGPTDPATDAPAPGEGDVSTGPSDPVTVPAATSTPTPGGGPSHGPTSTPTPSHTSSPTSGPTTGPTSTPTTHGPTSGPTHVPTHGPTSSPTATSTPSPTATSTAGPSCEPGTGPVTPTPEPTADPSAPTPTGAPTCGASPTPSSAASATAPPTAD